jgi:hypothetical protein
MALDHMLYQRDHIPAVTDCCSVISAWECYQLRARDALRSPSNLLTNGVFFAHEENARSVDLREILFKALPISGCGDHSRIVVSQHAGALRS